MQSNANPSKVTKRQSISKAHKAHQPAPVRLPTPPKAIVSQGQFTPPMESHEELAFAPPAYHHHDERERSNTPPVFSYTTYPAPDELLINPYGSAHAYPTMTTAEAYPNYLTATAMPPSLPPLSHYSEPIKRELYPDNVISPYIGYGFMPTHDMGMPTPYDPSNPLVSSSTHLSYSRDLRC